MTCPIRMAAPGRRPIRGGGGSRDGTAPMRAATSRRSSAADGWGLRRLALHYAGLAAETGCDGLLIGSEMRGLTWTRDAAGGYPAVGAYRTLAADCRAVVGPDVALSYAADWSEYSGHRPGDGSGDVIFHLDPLWADRSDQLRRDRLVPAAGRLARGRRRRRCGRRSKGRTIRPIWRARSRAGRGSTGSMPTTRIGRRRCGRRSSIRRMARTGCSGPRTWSAGGRTRTTTGRAGCAARRRRPGSPG